MKDTILITGVSGFIGSHLALLLGQNYTIIAPVRSASLSKTHIQDLKKQGHRIVEGDFYREEVLKTVFAYKPDFVIHLAAIRGEQEISSEIYREINVDATEILLNYSRQNNVSKFIYCSSVGVLGTIPANNPARYSDEANPDNNYHRSKWESENLVKKYHNEKFQTCILRPTVTYGVRDDGFLTKLIDLVKNKNFVFPLKPVSIHMLNVASFADICKLVLQKAALNGDRYLVADKNPVELADLVDVINFEMNGKPYPKYFRLPKLIFSFALSLLKWAGKSQLRTSVQLISNNWTYDIERTISEFGFKPADTMESVEMMIHGEKIEYN